MQTIHTSVIARRVHVESDFHTLPYEAGWAGEAVFFVQLEGAHPPLTISTQISPDGIHWITRGEAMDVAETAALTEIPLTVFGNWVRLAITGASESRPARVLVHLVLKG